MQFSTAVDKVGGEKALNRIRHVLQTRIGAMGDPMKVNFDLFQILEWVLVSIMSVVIQVATPLSYSQTAYSVDVFLPSNYLFKVSNWGTGAWCRICS